ncbi:DUF924 family protein [Hyphomicrobium sp. NDB2Meth4]|uniref:DUF924 family protein n=1 Tax=Hyphomicrobium sp. NDB2Meth4 TaxID=1892846 RepID=UPI000931D130|nr:DUF924 family protein [Hyphomicrobium sp. NDB2Meth4]
MTAPSTDPAWVRDVLTFWFDELGRKSWFAKDDAIDEAIKTRFAPLIDEINVRPVEEVGVDVRIFPLEHRVFLYLPFEHSEALPDQLRSVELISTVEDEEFTRHAEAHRDVIARFGRFPHRNAILGRSSTPEEIAFLEQPGSSF